MSNFKYLIVMKYSVNEGDKFGKFTVIKKVKHINISDHIRTLLKHLILMNFQAK